MSTKILGSNSGADLYVSYNGLVMGPPEDPSSLCGGSCDILTPYVTRTDKFEYVGSRSYRVTELSISGKIYSDTVGDGFTEINTKRNNILNAFDEDYKTLTAGRWTFDYIVVNDVTFSEGNVGIIDFNISLSSYEDFFNDTGILEPKDEYSFTEQPDGVIVCRHIISARCPRLGSDDSDPNSDGDYDEDDPIARAKAWCESKDGYTPGFTSAAGLAAKFSATDSDGASIKPFSVSHSYSRINGTYSIEETYKQGAYSDSGYVEKYSISEKRSLEEEHSTIQINYSIQAPPGKSISTIRSHVPSVSDFKTKISSTDNYGIVYNDSYNSGTIDGTPVTYEVSESPDESSITVSIAFNQVPFFVVSGGLISHSHTITDIACSATNYFYDSGTSGYAFLDYDISLSTDEVTQITTVDINAVMKSEGSLSTQRTRIKNWFEYITDRDNSGCVSSSEDEVNEPELCGVSRFLYALAHREYSMTETLSSSSIADKWAYGSWDSDFRHGGTSAGILHCGWEYGYEAPGTTTARLVKFSDLWGLNPWSENINITKGAKSGKITMSATFSNKDMYFVKYSDIHSETSNQYIYDVNRNPLTGAADVGTYFHWRNFSFNISQKCAIPVMSIKSGMNGNALFHDYLIFDHKTLSKEENTFDIKTDLEFLDAGNREYPFNRRGQFIRFGNIALSLTINKYKLMSNILDENDYRKPLGLDYRGLENYNSSRAHGVRGSYGVGSVPGNFSRNFTISQTVNKPYMQNPLQANW